MNDDVTVKVIQALAARTVEIQARCDALGSLVAALAMRTGVPQAKAEQAVEKMTAHFHQKRLERLEDTDPAGAAALDNRDIPNDIFE
jgi:hypothetical protein